ncbi:MAG: mechanosensitive ion channel protein MscL [Oligoflexia bacterium]|nr:MAG: mechanosensitive ion channel protein MscL [Oligoflexia bacterium]
MRNIASEATQWLYDTILFMPNWKWIGLTTALIAGHLILGLARHFIEGAKSNFISKQNPSGIVRHLLEENIHSPLAWLILIGFWNFALETLNLHETLTKNVQNIIQAVLIFHLIRLASMGVDSVSRSLEEFVKTTENTLDDQLAPFITKTLKVLVIVFGVLLALQSFGFNVMSLLAGLGLGGLALALAAQDTAANVFGSITIILDRPFQMGDWVKVGDTEGVVEEVGFRSTRIRTFYKSLVTIPNSTMAKEKIDNMGVRPLRRIRHTLGIVYGTPVSKIQDFQARIKLMINSRPEVSAPDTTVVFNALGDFSLQILVNFFVQVADSGQELAIQESVLLEILKIAEEMGVEFAYPTQTIHVAKS